MSKRFCIIVLIYYLPLFAFSQSGMRSKKYRDLMFFDITNKEKKDMLKNNSIISKENGPERDEYYYLLTNGKILYEILGVKNYLFLDKNDYDKFIFYSENPMEDKVLSSYSEPITDANFIDLRADYVSIFEDKFNFKFNFNDRKKLCDLDVLLNSLDVATIKQFRFNLVAIYGEFLVKNIENAHWKWIMIPSQGRYPLIMISDKQIIDPASLLYTELNKKISKDSYKINVYRQIINYL